ncbi:MAG TPA: DsbE family thiol:disulfide interchange protein [Rhizomicrobium sp.]|jgi:cytochrome c biogenesis protein CcmG/thiol:disulfide interchange protein DsbE|nr:DsbE family thiol:disulfide interchange protein [Rhizomicrobium sp.]
MKRVLYIAPFLIFVVLAIVFYWSLKGPAPDVLPSVMIGKPVPARVLAALDDETKGFAPADLTGHVTIVNVWASWCIPCRQEAPALAELAKDKSIQLWGFVYKDKPAAARAFLAEYGNPFSRIGLDADGSTAIEWGVYGVPETYVIDAQGVIRERYVGPLTPDALATVIAPAIQRARI